MKLVLKAMFGAVMSLSVIGQAPASEQPIELRDKNVYRHLLMMSNLKLRDEPTARRLVYLVLADGQVDPEERRLLDALSQSQFDLVVVPAPGMDFGPAEVRYSGKLSDSARAALQETEPLDYRAIIDNPDMAGIKKLVSWMSAASSQRAAATEHLVEALKTARTRQPVHENGEWSHYRELVLRYGDLLLPSKDPVSLQARIWFYQAAMIDDREAGDTVPDFLYTWMLDASEFEQAAKARSEVESLLKERAAK